MKYAQNHVFFYVLFERVKNTVFFEHFGLQKPDFSDFDKKCKNQLVC